LTGILDNIRIYNRALSASEVDQLYSAEAPPFSETFGSGSNQFSIDFVRIGNPGNAADTTGSPNPAGSVGYNYNIGKYEISRDMINKANSASGLGITLQDMTSYGGNGVNKPATGISWYEAAKFVNWMNTSKGFMPAYKFDGSGNFQLWSAGDAGYNANNMFRNSLAKYVIASSNEWYKAAYGNLDGTWNNYPTGSDTAPAAVAGGTAANTAVYNGQSGPADITNAGGLSAYGTMGQGGNVWEWTETAYDGINNIAGEFRGLRGGSRSTSSMYLDASYLDYFRNPTNEFDSYGFRVASSATITNPTGVSPQFTSTNSFLGQVGVAFSNTVTASGTAPITFGGSNLPNGLSIATNGLITGTPTTAGTNQVVLTASNTYGVATQTNNFVIAKGTQTIDFAPISSVTFNTLSLPLTASASSGLPVTFESSNWFVATAGMSTAWVNGVGTTTITASQGGNENYEPAQPVMRDLIVTKGTHSITFGPLADRTANDIRATQPMDAWSGFGRNDGGFYLNGSVSSEGNVVYTSSNPEVAEVYYELRLYAMPTVVREFYPWARPDLRMSQVGKLWIKGVGTTTITATAPESDYYLAAEEVRQTQTVHPVTLDSGNITLTPPASLSYDGSPKTYTASASGVSGFSLQYEGILGTSYGPTATAPTNIGNYRVTATSSDLRYPGSKSANFEILKGNQNIIFGSLPIKYIGDAAFNLTATAGSGLTVTYTSSNTNVATVLGSLVTIMGEGTTTITASQAGDSNWNAASSVPQTLTVQPALNRGLVAYYPFNGNANDESGNGRHGTPQNTSLVTDRKGQLNGAYTFNKTSGRIVADYAGWPGGNSDRTVSLWVKCDSIMHGNLFTFGGGTQARVNTRFSLLLASDGIAFIGESNDSDKYWPGDLNGAGWHKLAITWQSGMGRIYLDGVVLGEFSKTLNTDGSMPFVIGSNSLTRNDEFFEGLLDEVRVYNRALSASEVDQLYSAEAPPISETFGSGSNQFSIDFVRIGNPGNAADTTGSPNPAGSVAYNYNIGKYEISRDMINKANSEGNLGITMYDMTNYGGNGINKPATGISWYQAAKFVNWLNTSKGFVPAYKFDSNGNFQVWSASDAGFDANNPYRNSLAKFVMPSRNEWYKAAYGSPSGSWYDYPTGTDTAPVAIAGGTNGNTVVYRQPTANGPSEITNAGGLSAYGTMGQGANAVEWVETAYDSVNDTAIEAQELRGGAWDYDSHGISSSSRAWSPPGYDNFFSFGFRVASSATLTNPTGVAPQFTSTNSFLGQVGVAFSNTVTASGTAPITFGGSNLPTGLNISTNGLISGTPTIAGTNIATLTASNAFGITNQTSTFVISKASPVLTWTPSPAASLTYPTGLSSTQLNATSSVAGTFSYNPTNGTVLNAGTNTLVATFTPSNTSNYSAGGTITNTVVVAKGTPAISTTPTASPITYGQALGESILSGGTGSMGEVSTLAGSGTAGFADGSGNLAQFNSPRPVTLDSSGNIYVGELQNHRIRKVTPAGVVTTLAGSGTAGFADGNGTLAEFKYISGLAVDSSGNVYVADNGNSRIRKVTPDGVVSSLAVKVTNPTAITVDSLGNLYVANSGSSILKVTSAGVVSAVGIDSSFPFRNIQGLAVDSSGNLYYGDSGRIHKVTPSGVVTTLAGGMNLTGGPYVDGTGSAARFGTVRGVAVDSSGNVYVADSFNGLICKITPAGVVRKLAGSGVSGFADGNGASAQFNIPEGVAIDSSGNVYVGDVGNHRIRKVAPSLGEWTFANSSIVPNAGTSSQTVVFTPTDTANYNTVTASVSVVAKGSNVINFGALPVKYLDEGSFTLNATASSGLAVSYTSSDTNVATVSGNTVTFKRSGWIEITANQAGDSKWYEAVPVIQYLNVQARDTDGDGVTDFRELADGTNPNSNLSYDPINRDLIAYYPLTADQPANVNARDESGNGIHGILANTQGIILDSSGAQGSALQFSYFTDPPSKAAVYGTGIDLANRSFTVSLWVKRFFASGYGGWILRTGGVMYGEPNPGGSTGENLHIITDFEKVRFSFFYNDFDLYQPVPIGEWQNLVFVYDEEAFKRRIYVNGSLKAENTPAYGFTGNGNFSFGHQDVSLDEIRFYKKALSSSEVSQLYLATGSGFLPAITSTNSFLGQVGVVFSNTVTASGTAPIIFGGSNLPTGLSIATNGLISGTPSTAGTNTATLTASNAFGTTNQSATFVIVKGTPVISNWPTANPIIYGQALSNSVLSGGSANVLGAFAWVSQTNRPNVGTSSQSVSFTPTEPANYNSVTSNINVVVNKAAPVLTWTPSPAVGLTYPAPLTSTQLNATSSVDGTFSYNPSSGTVLNAGTNMLVGTFTPTDTASYSTGGTITNTVVVGKGEQWDHLRELAEQAGGGRGV